MEPSTPCPACDGTGLHDGEPCLECNEEVGGAGLRLAAELYAQEGTPCATCSCSYMTLRQSAGTSLGFKSDGLALRVCRKGREPLVAESGTGELWCDDYTPFSDLVTMDADGLSRMQEECSRGFLADLAQQVRPIPRSTKDLRWYDRGLREGWLPPHRVEVEGSTRDGTLHGPWNQFVVVGVTPAFGDGHTPAVGEAIVQAKDRRSYLLVTNPHSPEVTGPVQTHGWWVTQVSSGAALPLERPVEARQHARPLVLRGGERVLTPGTMKYLDSEDIDAELDAVANESLRSAEGALRRGQSMVAKLCVRKGLRARPQHPQLRDLQGQLGD